METKERRASMRGRMEVRGKKWRLRERREHRKAGREGRRLFPLPKAMFVFSDASPAPKEGLAHRRYLKVICVRHRCRGKPSGDPSALDQSIPLAGLGVPGRVGAEVSTRVWQSWEQDSSLG